MTERIEEVGPEEWDDLLERSRQATPFHLAGCLEQCADTLGARLYRYVGYKGQEPTGLFPVLELRRGPFGAALSPVPGLVPYGGPALLMPDGLKRRKRERWNRSLVDSVIERVDEEIDPAYCQVRTSPKFRDERPFLWSGHDPTVRYTYVVGLPDDGEPLVEAFGSGARTDEGRCDWVTVTEADIDAVEPVVGLVGDRRAGRPDGIDPAFVRALYRRLPEGCVRVYTCRDGDRLLGGCVTLELRDTVYGWLGASDPSSDVPAGELLCGHLLRDACRRGYTEYDSVGASDPRLAWDGSSLAPELRSYVGLVRRGPVGWLAARLCGLATGELSAP